MKEFKNGTYTGERALFALQDATIVDCVFEDGESPLKEGRNLQVNKTTFRWKYPLWYCHNVEVKDCVIEQTARSGIWYTFNINMTDCMIASPKTFRRSGNIVLNNCEIPNAQETLWNCKDIKLKNVKIKGDYLGFNSSDIEIDNMELDGNYAFDGAKNIVIRNSILYTKDAFWNSENVTVIDSTIIGEYLGWNTKNITLINCTIESHQGFCSMEKVKMVNCKLINSDLCFEYCSDLDIELAAPIDSIKNPYSGKIVAPEIKELILDEKFIDPSKTEIIIK